MTMKVNESRRFDPDTGRVTETIVASHLNCPHGLAFHEGVLYVSRTRKPEFESGSE